MDGNSGKEAAGRLIAPVSGSSRQRRAARVTGPLAAAVAVLLASFAPAVFGCRSREATPAPKPADPEAAPAAVSRALAGVAPSPSEPLGLGELTALGWRERGGQEAFRQARAAERRGDWAAMVARCEEALAADPSHLEASWLLAAGLSHLKRFSEVGAPLARAVAGDPGKWVQPALSLSLFAPFWASGQGEALEAWIASLPPRAGEVLGRSVLLSHKGRLVAFDPREQRWLPVGRRMHVAAALRLPARLVYVARGKLPGAAASSSGAAPASSSWVLGVVELSSGATREVALPAGQRFEVVEVAAAPPSVGAPAAPRLLVRADRGAWQEVVGEQLAAAAKGPRAEVPRLVITKGKPEVVRLPIAGVVADWDQAAMASALRIRRSNRLVAPPAPALIDGQRVQWSPAATKLALVASLEDCERAAEPASPPPAATLRRTLAYVVDPTTGALREVAQSAAGIELQWVSEQQLAISTDRGVELLDFTPGSAAAGAPTPLGPQAAELSLTVPVSATRCPGAPDAPTSEEPPLPPGTDLDDL